MPYEQVLTEERGRVGIVTLSNPDKLNALGEPMDTEMREAIEAYNQNPEIGAIVLTGAGKGFCAGANIQGWDKGIQRAEDDGDAMRIRDRRENWVSFVQRSKPIIAAINGVSIGAGLTITLPCDVRYASERARLSMRFVRVGVLPELASTRLLVHIVGLGQAMELMPFRMPSFPLAHLARWDCCWPVWDSTLLSRTPSPSAQEKSGFGSRWGPPR